jgi:hypothetical protein
MSKWNAVYAWTRLLAPLVLANISQTRALAGHVATLMDDAEAVAGAKGPDKLTQVVLLAHAVGEGLNQEKSGLIDLDALDGAMTSGIDVAFDLAKVVAAAHGAPASPPAIPIVPGALVLPPST